MAKDNMTHSVMPKKLAEALMEAGVQHFATGGTTQSGPSPYSTTEDSFHQGDYGGAVMSGSNPMEGIRGIVGAPQQLSSMVTAQNQYMATDPNITRQNNFGQRIGLEQGRQGDVYGQQQNLANMLLAQSQGQGPNPAQAQYNQNVGQAAKAQGALMASQRGASSNPALIARQAAMQGAAMQNQASGQAATLQAQQQLAAQQALAQQQQNMYGNALQGENIAQGALASENSARTTGQLGAEGINATTAQANTNAVNQTTGQIFGSLGGGGVSSLFNKGGKVPNYDMGGTISYATPASFDYHGLNGVGIVLPKSGDKGKSPKKKQPTESVGTAQPWELGGGMAGGPGDSGGPAASGLMTAARGGRVPGYDDGGEIDDNIRYDSPSFGSSAAGGSSGGVGVVAPKKQGGGGIMSMLPMLAMLKDGGQVGGKPKVGHDDKKNDTVPAMLSPGEEVIDLDTLNDPGPIGKAARMVAAHINAKKEGGSTKGHAKKAAEFMKHLSGGKKSGGFGNVIKARSCGGKI